MTWKDNIDWKPGKQHHKLGRGSGTNEQRIDNIGQGGDPGNTGLYSSLISRERELMGFSQNYSTKDFYKVLTLSVIFIFLKSSYLSTKFRSL